MTNKEQGSSESTFLTVEDVREAMFQSVEGGEFHPRQKIREVSALPYADYLSIGFALRACLLNPLRHEELIQRLRPHAGAIIGILPPGIQAQGLLPKDEELKLESFEQKNLDQVNDAQLKNYFEQIAPMLSPGGQFVDLGSGLGKVVMSAGLHFPFDTCKGIEIVPYRHKMAFDRFLHLLKVGQDGLNRLKTPTHAAQFLAQSASPEMKVSHLLNLPKRVSFQLGDMFACDVSQASLVFIYSTCFGSFMHKIAHKLANEVPEGCLVSSTTYAMSHPGLELVKHFPAKSVAWTDIYVYKRVGSQALATPPEPFAYVPNLEEWEAKARELLKPAV